MTLSRRLKMFVLTTALGAALVGGCSTQFRDALQAGTFDFVSGSVTSWLQALVPVAPVE